MVKKKRKMTPAEQSAAFIEAAKKAEADERPEEFDAVMGKIARAKPLGARSRPSSKRSSA